MFKFFVKSFATVVTGFLAYEGFSFSLLCINTPNDFSLFLGFFVLIVLFVLTPYTITRIWRPNEKNRRWD